jgi:hypothetical protein
MPKIIEYTYKGTRTVTKKKDCNSCWDCAHCHATCDPALYICVPRALSNRRNWKFPFDNTKCEEFKPRDGK